MNRIQNELKMEKEKRTGNSSSRQDEIEGSMSRNKSLENFYKETSIQENLKAKP